MLTIFSPKRHNGTRTLVQHTHFGKRVLINPDPFKLAKIGEEIETSILLPKKYVPEGVEFEPIEVYGRLRGRTLYILLDKPIIVNGQEESIINLKGAGADWKNRRMQIDLSKTCARYEKTPRSNLSSRPWGGMILSSTKKPKPEFDYNRFFVSEVAVNLFPKAINDHIAKLSKTSPEELVQTVRVAPNTVRLDEFYLFGEEHCSQNLDVSAFVTFDSELIRLYYEIRKKNKYLIIYGLLNDNRYPNGQLTDVEDWYVEPLDTNQLDILGYLPAYLIAETLSVLPDSLISKYILGMRSAIPILNEWFDLFITHLETYRPSFNDPLVRFDSLGMVDSLIDFFANKTNKGNLDQFGNPL